jgi:hypothetical protein
MTLPRSSALILGLGVLLLVAAGVWWALVFEQVVAKGYMPLASAAKCLAVPSFGCQLAMSLCLSDHPWGVIAYRPEAFFLALGTLVLGFVTTQVQRA